MFDRATTLDVLREGEIEIVGRIVGSSNNAMLVSVSRVCPDPEPVQQLDAVYKPILGERPLNDFPDGTLARREVAAWHVSEASGWGIVPPTVLRDGPFGEGMVQSFVEADPEVDIVSMILEDDPRLRRMAVLDAVMNNTDRKGGHILAIDGGSHLHGVDHGVCFSPVPKLRTVLWGWRGQPFDAGRDRRPRADQDGPRRRARGHPSDAAQPDRGSSHGSSNRQPARPWPLPVPVTNLARRPLAAVLGPGVNQRTSACRPGITTPPAWAPRAFVPGCLLRQPAVRAALTTMVLANLSWKPCLVGLL